MKQIKTILLAVGSVIIQNPVQATVLQNPPYPLFNTYAETYFRLTQLIYPLVAILLGFFIVVSIIFYVFKARKTPNKDVVKHLTLFALLAVVHTATFGLLFMWIRTTVTVDWGMYETNNYWTLSLFHHLFQIVPYILGIYLLPKLKFIKLSSASYKWLRYFSIVCLIVIALMALISFQIAKSLI